MILRWAPVLLVGACQPATLPAPRLDRVDPAFAYNGEEHAVTIVGANFYPQVEVSAADGSVDVDRTFGAWLVGPGAALQRVPFAGVSIEDDAHLRATVEAGLEPGLYDLEVEGPTGKTARLSQAFTVTDTEAVRLVVSSERVVYQISEAAEIEVELVDLGGEVVEIPLEIAVVTTVPATFGAGSLAGAVPTPDGDGIRGTLQAGRATVTVQPDLPGQVQISAAPWDPEVAVLDDSIDLTFEPGDSWQVELLLPQGESSFVAGEPFVVSAQLVDQYANPVQTPTSVTLRTDCSGWVDDVVLQGPTQVEVLPEFACDDDRVSVVTGPRGESDPFQVVAGPADHFEVVLGQTVRTAGDVLAVLVEPVDAYGNRASWLGSVTLETDLEALDGQCTPLFGWMSCTPTVTRAGDALTVIATGDDGLTGQVTGLQVLPDEIPGSLEVVTTGPAIAGAAHPVDVIARDAWGNAMDAAVLGAGAIDLTDDLDEAACVSTGFGPAGEALFDCALYTARAGATLTADALAFGVQGTSAPLQVDNGPLGLVDFTGEVDIDAGQVLNLGLSTFDAWGNPYVVQTVTDLDLSDDSGTWSQPLVTLQPDGTASVSGTLTRAGTTHIRASTAGVEVGVSDPIRVDPAPTAELRVTPLAPWGWVGVPLDVRVETVDIYGNRTDVGTTATLSSQLTPSPDVGVTLVNGVGVSAFTWSTPALFEVLDAQAASFTGSSVALVVGDDCGASGPTPAVTFAGSTDAVACVDPLTDLATVTADFSGSTPGTSPLAGYALAREGDLALLDTTPVIALELPGAGVHPLVALAVDTAGCMAEVPATGWAGPDDGSVVGPVPLETTAVDVAVFDTVAFDVLGATDCAGDPAAYQDVLLRTTAGALSGVGVTGGGLALTLDVNGDGTFDLTTSGRLQAGTAQVHAWVPSGGAGARVDLPLVGDNVLPTVVAQSPTGLTAGLVSEVTLTFSEPMLPTTLVPGSFSLTGPSAPAIQTATPGAGDTEVTLVFDAPADAGLGLFTLTGSLALRDAAGNRIAGQWGGAASTYAGSFGTSAVVVDDVVCTVQGDTTFRPDGDDGAGIEADTVDVDLTSAGAPAWWVLEVADGGGALVDQQWLVPSGATDTVSWDGRDLTGVVVDNGAYELRIRPDDGLGNRGNGCDLALTVSNALGL